MDAGIEGSNLSDRGNGFIERNGVWLALAGLPLILLLAVVNASMLILPRRNLDSNVAFRVAGTVEDLTAPDDLIVTDPDDIVTLYLVYFARRTVLPAANLSSENGALGDVFEEIFDETEANGGQIYLLQGDRLEFLRP